MNLDIIEEIRTKMAELFGDCVVDPNVFPKQFDYQAKIALWYLRNPDLVKPK